MTELQKEVLAQEIKKLKELKLQYLLLTGPIDIDERNEHNIKLRDMDEQIKGIAKMLALLNK